MRLQMRKPTAKQLLALCICTVIAALVLFGTRNGSRTEESQEPRNRGTPEGIRLDNPATSTGPEGSSSKEQRLAAVCADTTCAEKFLLKFLQKKQQPPIPTIRHILWKSENVSKHLLRQLKSWQQVQPDWTFVLWRNSDLEPFVRKYYPGKIYRKFKSLPEAGENIIRKTDLFKYMLLYKFGGVYADLDYTLVSSLDTYRRYSAVVTREPEAHAVQHFGLSKWPLSIMANAALLMSAPGHPFFGFVLSQLVERDAASIKEFAGPHGLSRMLSKYYQMHLVMVHKTEFVYIPPSYSFYPYDENRLKSGGGDEQKARIFELQRLCGEAASTVVQQVQEFCNDVTNLDPITDKSQPLIAIRDMKQMQQVYAEKNMTRYLRDLKLGNSFT